VRQKGPQADDKKGAARSGGRAAALTSVWDGRGGDGPRPPKLLSDSRQSTRCSGRSAGRGSPSRSRRFDRLRLPFTKRTVSTQSMRRPRGWCRMNVGPCGLRCRHGCPSPRLSPHDGDHSVRASRGISILRDADRAESPSTSLQDVPALVDTGLPFVEAAVAERSNVWIALAIRARRLRPLHRVIGRLSEGVSRPRYVPTLPVPYRGRARPLPP